MYTTGIRSEGVVTVDRALFALLSDLKHALFQERDPRTRGEEGVAAWRSCHSIVAGSYDDAVRAKAVAHAQCTDGH